MLAVKIEVVWRGSVKLLKIYIEGLKKYLAIKFGCCVKIQKVCGSSALALLCRFVK